MNQTLWPIYRSKLRRPNMGKAILIGLAIGVILGAIIINY